MTVLLTTLLASLRRNLGAARLSPRVLAAMALVGANVIWGGSAVASKIVQVHVPPLTLACLRVAVAAVILRLLLVLTGGHPMTGRAPALLGLTGVAVFCAGQNLGLRYASASTTSLLNGAVPVLTALLAVWFLGERLRGQRLVGLLVGLVGIAVLVLAGSGAASGAAAVGNLLPLASAVGSAAYFVINRRILGRGSALTVVAGSTSYGLIYLLPGAILELIMVGLGPVTVRDGVLLLYLGAGCSALAFVLVAYGLSHLEAGHGAVFGGIKPVVGVVLAIAVLGEPITFGMLGGGVLVLLGVGIASESSRLSRAPAMLTRPFRPRSRHVLPTRPWPPVVAMVPVSGRSGGRRRARRGV